MPLSKINTLTLALSMAVNAMLMFILLVKFRTSPADVLVELQKTELKISMKLAEADAKEEHILDILDDRRKWILELTTAVKKGFDGGAFVPPTPPQ